MDNHNGKLGNAFKKGGVFADNIRISTDGGNDDELRESLKAYGWVEEFPALSDEHDVILIGHRRLKIAEELGIKSVIKKLEIGDGDEADAKRLRLAIVSNIGHKPMTKADRQRIAEYLYGEREWTMQRIADALNVSQRTISEDVSGLEATSKPSRPKGGRPKGKAKKSRKAPKPHDRTDEFVSLSKQGLSDEEISSQTGVSKHTIRREIERENIRETTKAEAPEIDLATLSMSMQEKCKAWKRQTEKRLRIEIAEEERKKVREYWNEDHLPYYREELAKAEAAQKAWKGVFSAAIYRRLLAALHPDRNTSSDAHDLFILFKAKEMVLLSEKERPRTSAWTSPKTYEEMMRRKAEVSAERKAKRAAGGSGIQTK